MGINLAVLTLVSLVQSTADVRPWLHVSASETTKGSFELPLNGPKTALLKHDKHVGGNLVFYFPDVQVKAERRELAYGPVKTLRTRTVRKGSVVVLEAAHGVSALANNTHVQLDPYFALVYTGPAIRPEPAPAGNTLEAAAADKEQKEIAVIDALEPQSIVRESESVGDDAVIEEISPELFGSQKKSWGSALGLKRSSKKVIKSNTDADKTPLLESMRADTQGSMQNLVGGLLLILSMGLLLIWRKRKGKASSSTLSTDSIEVIAVKSLGGKHRLALVEACGERILLATSDKDVSMLAQLGDNAQKATAFAQTLTELDQEEVAPEREHASGNDLAMNEVSASPVLKEKIQDVKGDLAGLLFLRKNKKPTSPEGTDTTSNQRAKKGQGIAA